MKLLIVLPLVALAACSLDVTPANPVAVAPESEAVTPVNRLEAPAAPRVPIVQPRLVFDHVWRARFEGERGDIPRVSVLENAINFKKIPEFLCSRTIGPIGETIVALNSSYTDLQEAGEMCWARVVLGGIGNWLELAAVKDSHLPKEWKRATTKLPDKGTLVGLAGLTTVTALHEQSDSGPSLTLQGWTSEAELRWTRTISANPSWPTWTPTGLLLIETQDARGPAGLTVLDPKTGDVVGTSELDQRLQQIVNDPWALVLRSRTAEWNATQWPPNAKGDLVTAGLRVEHQTDFYLKYDVYDVETKVRLWGKHINPGKKTATLFVDVEGPWLLVSIVSGAGDWKHNASPIEALTKQHDGIEVLAYELSTGKLVGDWDYKWFNPR